MESNENVCVTNHSLYTPENEMSSSKLNVTLQLLKEISDVRFDVIFKIPESADDTKYTRQLFRTSINVTRLLQGVVGNSLIKYFINQLILNLDFQLKFPLKPGIYRMINYNYKGEYLPPITTRLYYEVRMMGRFTNVKSLTNLGKFGKFCLCTTFEAYVKLN